MTAASAQRRLEHFGFTLSNSKCDEFLLEDASEQASTTLDAEAADTGPLPIAPSPLREAVPSAPCPAPPTVDSAALDSLLDSLDVATKRLDEQSEKVVALENLLQEVQACQQALTLAATTLQTCQCDDSDPALGIVCRHYDEQRGKVAALEELLQEAKDLQHNLALRAATLWYEESHADDDTTPTPAPLRMSSSCPMTSSRTSSSPTPEQPP